VKKKALLIVLVLIVIGGLAYWIVDSPDEPDTAQSNTNQNDLIVYEFEAESQDDCTSIETFDAENSVCFFECEDQAECDKLLAETEQELEQYLQEYSDNSANKEENVPQTQDDIQSDADYSVTTGEAITLQSGNNTPEHNTLWEQVSAISPDSLSDNYIETFRVFTAADDATAAYVDDDDDDGKFVLAFNLSSHNDSSNQEQVLTIVHELAHIFTLNKDQIAQGTCEYETQEGCFGNRSMLAEFVEKFWSAQDRERAQNEADLYTGNESNYVTQYASTNPEEDLAESFAYYVVRSDYSGSDIASQKQAFFDAYPEAVQAKQDMRRATIQQFTRSRIAQ